MHTTAAAQSGTGSPPTRGRHGGPVHLKVAQRGEGGHQAQRHGHAACGGGATARRDDCWLAAGMLRHGRHPARRRGHAACGVRVPGKWRDGRWGAGKLRGVRPGAARPRLVLAALPTRPASLQAARPPTQPASMAAHPPTPNRVAATARGQRARPPRTRQHGGRPRPALLPVPGQRVAAPQAPPHNVGQPVAAAHDGGHHQARGRAAPEEGGDGHEDDDVVQRAAARMGGRECGRRGDEGARAAPAAQPAGPRPALPGWPPASRPAAASAHRSSSAGSPVRLTAITARSSLTRPLPMSSRRSPLRAGTAAATRRADGSAEKSGQQSMKPGPASMCTSLRLRCCARRGVRQRAGARQVGWPQARQRRRRRRLH